VTLFLLRLLVYLWGLALALVIAPALQTLCTCVLGFLGVLLVLLLFVVLWMVTKPCGRPGS